MLELVKGSYNAYNAYLESEKNREKASRDNKRKCDKKMAAQNTRTEEKSALRVMIEEERINLNAAKRLVSSGQERLDEALRGSTETRDRC